MKLTTQPTISTAISVPVAPTPDRRNFSSLMAEAPTMVGMAMKKENSAPAPRATPSRMAPRMVEPEREVPGIRLRHWKQPMSKAVFRSMDQTLLTLGTRSLLRRSTRMNATP